MYEDRKSVIGESGIWEWCDTSLECKYVGICRTGDVYKYDTKL